MANTGVGSTPADSDTTLRSWTGLRRGGVYLVHGHTLATYRALSLLFLRLGIARHEPSLFISVGRPENLTSAAARVGLDLREAHHSGLLKMLRFSSTAGLSGLDDAQRTQALHDVSIIIRRHKPRRVVLDDLSPFLGFTSNAQLQTAVERFADQVASQDATVLIGLPTGPEDVDSDLLAALSAPLAGRIAVEVPAPETAPSAYRLTLVPTTTPSRTASIDLVLTDPATLSAADLGVEAVPTIQGGDGTSEEAVTAAEPRASMSPEPLDRDSFSLNVQQRFHRRAVSGHPFLLIAMRGDGERARRLDLRLLCDSTRELLENDDAWFVDDRRRRLIVALERHDAHDARRFFARLRARLRSRLPEEADVYLQSFTAVVVPDGGSFVSAEEFLSAAVDES